MSEATKTLKQLDEEAKGFLLQVKSIIEKGDEATIDERESVKTLTESAEAIVKRLDAVRGDNATTALKTINRIENTLASLHEPERPPFGGGRDVATHRGADFIKSAGTQFAESEDFKSWLKSMTPGGAFARQQFQSPPVVIEDPLGGFLKTIVTAAGSTSGGPFIWNDQRRDIIAPAPFRPFVVRQFITTLQTVSDAIEYIRITGYTNAAATVAEATAESGTSGTKPESAMATERVTDAIKTIAHWIPITTRALQDGPQIRGIIDSFLRDGLEEELEDQMVAGDATGENFDGMLHVSGTTAQAFDTDLLVTTRKARTACRVTGRAIPNAYLFNPADWETIDLLQDAEQRYYFGGPMQLGTPRLWGLPVVETEAMTEGSATCGDHKECILWDRQQMMVSAGNQHDKYFIRNMVALLAELRAGFGIRRPAAIVVMDLTE